MMKRVVVLLLVVLLLVVSPLVACSNSGGGVTNPVGLVPAKANMIAQADLSSILRDNELTGIYDKYLKDTSYPQTFNDALNKAKEEAGIDLKNLEEAICFADISESTDNVNYGALLVKGTLEEKKLIEALEKYGEVELIRSDYRGYQLYTAANEDGALVFFSNKMLVLGSTQAVKDVVDVKNGDAKALNDEVMDTYNKLGNALIKVAVEVPPGAVGKNLGQSTDQIPGNLSAFDKVKTAGLTVVKNNETVTLNIKLCCADSSAAESVESSINGLIGIIGFALSMSEDNQQHQTLINLLDKVEVSRSGSCVNLGLSMTVTEIEDLIQSSNQTA